MTALLKHPLFIVIDVIIVVVIRVIIVVVVVVALNVIIVVVVVNVIVLVVIFVVGAVSRRRSLFIINVPSTVINIFSFRMRLGFVWTYLCNNDLKQIR